jgi:hypothetical protein
LEYVGTRETSVEGTSETLGGGFELPPCRGSWEKEETKLEVEEAAASGDLDSFVGLLEESSGCDRAIDVVSGGCAPEIGGSLIFCPLV